MKKTIILSLVVVLSGTLLLAGCGEKKAAEKAVEKASNGAVDVDIDNNKVTINTNEGTIEVGDSVKLPSDFPSDVYVIDGTIKGVTHISENKGYTVSIETTKSVSQAKTEYENELKEEGWNITFSMNIQNGASMTAEKDNRNLTVSISSDGETTQVVLGTGQND